MNILTVKDMKTRYVYLMMALLAVNACRTAKEQSTTAQAYHSGERELSAVLSRQYDSTDRYWFFESDSLFYYRPGGGLYGIGGLLTVAEGEVKQGQEKDITFRDRYTEDTFSKEEYTAKPVSRTKYLWSLVIAALIVIIGVWLWKRKGRCLFGF